MGRIVLKPQNSTIYPKIKLTLLQHLCQRSMLSHNDIKVTGLTHDTLILKRKVSIQLDCFH